MNLVIYNPFSFGGNYDYIRSLSKAYTVQKEVRNVTVVMPGNAKREDGQKRILLPDQIQTRSRLFKKIYFLYRSIVNPFRFYRFLKQAPAGSVVIFNDYDQLTSILWVPVFKRLKPKLIFSIILHDPDRDKYLPSKRLSVFSMKRVMSLMDLAFYHGKLPERSYYTGTTLKVEVPHGIYESTTPDAKLEEQLHLFKGSNQLLSIIGNIRAEKNYELTIHALQDLPGFKLLIAGSKSNSAVPLEEYRLLVSRLGLSDRVLFIEKFMTDAELQACVKVSDIVLLYYSRTFTSQSGILNLIAPYKKKVLVADSPSALTQQVKRFALGEVVPTDDKLELVKGINKLASSMIADNSWEQYIASASWAAHAQIAVENFKKISKN